MQLSLGLFANSRHRVRGALFRRSSTAHREKMIDGQALTAAIAVSPGAALGSARRLGARGESHKGNFSRELAGQRLTFAELARPEHGHLERRSSSDREGFRHPAVGAT